jgi:hypothetical protein
MDLRLGAAVKFHSCGVRWCWFAGNAPRKVQQAGVTDGELNPQDAT